MKINNNNNNIVSAIPAKFMVISSSFLFELSWFLFNFKCDCKLFWQLSNLSE